ncbi:hypothetical protein EOL96_01845 [Candidatus Saccharibacteria bacterium]|nr:hypothetical protein [Candidatus Saccharibacteria bacterium]
MILLWNSADMKIETVFLHGETTYAYEWNADRTLAKEMLAYLRDRLAEHELTFDDIESIGVFRGPGSYTGLRIGLTVLNTLAHSYSIPIVGAVGSTWQEICTRRILQGENDFLVLPEYGAQAHVTKPRK